MEAKLVVVAGEAKEGEYKLKLPTVVGRSRTTDLTLGHPLVSRQHCELYEQEGVLMVRDLGSLNGTFVGDTRIAAEVPLEPGSLLTIGTITFKAVYGGVSQAAVKKPAKAAVAAIDTPAEIQQTMQADGLSSLEQLRDSHAAPEIHSEEEPQELELDWLEEAEEEVAELQELEVEELELEEPAGQSEQVPTLGQDDFELDELEEAPLEELETLPVETVKKGATAKADESQAASSDASDDGLDDFFKTLE